jgi:hypothetical protein
MLNKDLEKKATNCRTVGCFKTVDSLLLSQKYNGLS